MRVMQLCDRSRTSKFSTPAKPWMDVSLLWPSFRTRKLVMFSQSTNEMLFSWNRTNGDLVMTDVCVAQKGLKICL